MVSIVSTLSGTNATNASAIAFEALKDELSKALNVAGIADASASDKTPKGFPNGVSWQDAYKMVSSLTKEDANSPAKLTISKEKLAKNISATKTLKELGYTDLSKFKKGLSVDGALDSLLQNKTNGVLGSIMAKAGVYDLSSFPQGISTYQAFKLIEDSENPGKISLTKLSEIKNAFSALSSLGIKSLANFPRATTALEAKNLLEPKATQMLSMLGMSTNNFKKPNISALEAMSVLSKLPDSIRELNALPKDTTAAALASNAAAAKKLVAMGYESLTPFAAMTSLKGSTVTPSEALAQINKTPVPADLPLPTATNTERLFQSPTDNKVKSYGAHNEIRNSVYVATAVDRAKPNPAPGITIVTAAEVLAANSIYWSRK